MYQEWIDNHGIRRKARIDAPVMQFVELIGEDETARLLMHYGGTPIYVSRRPEKINTILNVISRDSLEKLAIHFGIGRAGGRVARLPLGTLFLIRHMHSNGTGIYEIARRLRVTDKYVRTYLKSSKFRSNVPAPGERNGRGKL